MRPWYLLGRPLRPSPDYPLRPMRILVLSCTAIPSGWCKALPDLRIMRDYMGQMVGVRMTGRAMLYVLSPLAQCYTSFLYGERAQIAVLPQQCVVFFQPAITA